MLSVHLKATGLRGEDLSRLEVISIVDILISSLSNVGFTVVGQLVGFTVRAQLTLWPKGYVPWAPRSQLFSWSKR